LAGPREPGYDAKDATGRCLQIKTRRVVDAHRKSQRVGSINLKHPWDAVLLVLVDEGFQAISIWEASRGNVEKALAVPGSIARNKRGALAVSKFMSIGECVWQRVAA
jgi:hypothetical protein